MSEPTLNPFRMAQQRVHDICEQLQLDPAVYERLKNLSVLRSCCTS